jgi:hypothetical protein
VDRKRATTVYRTVWLLRRFYVGFSSLRTTQVMTPRAILVASAVGVGILLLGSAALGSGEASPRPQALAAQKYKKCKSKACKRLKIGQGVGGQAVCGPPQFVVGARANPGSRVLKFSTERSPVPFYSTAAGDLLVAAILTEGASIPPPRGWQRVPDSDVSNGASQRLQIFSAIPVPVTKPGEIGPDSYSFPSSTPQAMSGTLINVSGVSQVDPINAAAGAANATASAGVTAPSINPTAANTRLLFVGAASAPQTWTAPPGMKQLVDSPRSSRIGLAHQWWPTATATGTRTATISSSAPTIGDLIALNFPAPATCPKIRILNRFLDRRKGRLFRASASGLISVRLKCEWSEPCVGALGLMVPTPVAAGDIEVPAGETRTVQIPVCKRGTGCPNPPDPRLLRGLRESVIVAIVLFAPNGQLVDATGKRDDRGYLVLP